jgi:hypothetical protein
MTTIVKNVGTMFKEKETRGFNKVQGDQGTVIVWYQGQQFVFGPNESKSLENGIASALVSADARLRIATQADGMAAKSNASLSVGIY